MFRDALKIATNFTRPVVLSRKTIEGKCTSAIGSYVVINDEGWIVTAAHILNLLENMHKEKLEVVDRQNQIDSINSDQTIDEREKKRRRSKIRKIPKEKTDAFSPWWGLPNGSIQLVDACSIPAADLAIGRLDPFDPKWISDYPTFKDPSKNFDSGTSLCKLGFPFHTIIPSWNDNRGIFELPPGALPIPFFPIDGIFTRTIQSINPGGAQSHPILFIETSTPGLRGQSGGPTIDTKGVVWAIQSSTSHLPLGFSPDVPGGNGQKEHQFLNVGIGVHPSTFLRLFTDKGIKFTQSDY